MTTASANSEWVRLRVLVTVKAYPSISTKYGEAICIAGIRLDTPTPAWVRLFPVRYRDLPVEKQFKKYEAITVEAQKHSTDQRAETWRPNVDSIERGDVVPAGGPWLARRRLVEPLIGPTMCQLHRGRKGGGAGGSLGLVRPARVRGIRVTRESDWSAGQLGTVGQGSLLTTKTELVKPGVRVLLQLLLRGAGVQGAYSENRRLGARRDLPVLVVPRRGARRGHQA